jgi:hypothetical protein
MAAPASRTRLAAPTPPDGWVIAPPDFIGVGTARSGTTWWDGLIAAHPDVARAPGVPKELHFFDERWAEDLDDGAIAAYHAFFARPPGKRAGEWTPGYMLDAWTPRLIRAAAPDARLIVLVRDPVERFRSGRTLAENRFAVGSTARAAANAAFGRGLYADQLLRLWRSWPREQVLVLQYERCLSDARAELRKTFAFLDLDPAAAESMAIDVRVNASSGPKVTLTDWQADLLARRYAPENERLASLVPDLDLTRWTRPA